MPSEITPRPKRLLIAIGVGGTLLLIVLAVIR